MISAWAVFDWLGSIWDYLDAALDYKVAAVIAVGAWLTQPAMQLITTANSVAYSALYQPSDGQEQQHHWPYYDVS